MPTTLGPVEAINKSPCRLPFSKLSILGYLAALANQDKKKKNSTSTFSEPPEEQKTQTVIKIATISERQLGGGIVLSILCALPHLIPTIAHCIDEEVEAQRDEVACSRSPRGHQLVQGQCWNPNSRP